MRFAPLIVAALLSFPLSSSASPDAALQMMLVSGEAQVQNVDPLCKAKALVAQYAYTHRPKMKQKNMLKMVEEEWEKRREAGGSWSTFDYATYVDMERIIRRAYRKNGGKFRHECCTKDAIIEQMRAEYWDCKYNGF